ncbi:hypothetical protein [Flavobacterium silvaticum]|uniref:SGNH/GDSL hydrolase family protein n=1 Tax=Flavobacterium silvaticum TaxID=1852020 RepID=A0A972FW95_9FLAO|nr:hypothetical protein [Flavobacterium silvaticum]NMH28790.1 hypothetical protein [Flavobacterium silvaticum]
MKKFLKRLSLFCLPLVILSYPIDRCISINLEKSNGYAMKEYEPWRDLVHGKVNSDIAIYGSSRAWVMADPQLLSDTLGLPAYNLGVDGYTFGMEYCSHRLLLDRNRQPKLIVQILDPHTLTYRDDLYNPDQFLPFLLWDREFISATSGRTGYNLLDKYVPLIRYYGKLGAIKEAFRISRGQPNPVERKHGFQSSDRNWMGDFEKVKKNFHRQIITIDSRVVQQFNDFLSECRLKGIKVVFVFAPEYIKGQSFTKNRAEVMELYRDIAIKNKIPFYDYSQDSLSMDQSNFYNVSHMNSKGAKKFSSDLAHRLKMESDFKILFGN